jgi:biopolymer transport protein ExbB
MFKKITLALAICLACHPAANAAGINFSAQIAEGGIALVVILLLSILFVTVSAERLVNFRAKHIFSNDLLEHVRPLWAEGSFEKIHVILSAENSTLARVINYMASHRNKSLGMITNGVSDIASIELRSHQQKSYALAIVATVAPIVGLLGTVIGMIEAFHVIAFSEGMGNPTLLAGGISKALVNTAAGLSVALPALAMHHFFKHRSASYALSLEKTINQLLNEWFVDSENHSHTEAQSHATNLHVVNHAH